MAFKPTASLKTLLPDFITDLTSMAGSGEDGATELAGAELTGAELIATEAEQTLREQVPCEPVSRTASQTETITETATPTYDDAADSAESELVAAAQQNPEAFGALYERYVDRVYAYIYHRVGGSTHDAEDLTALTFYRALSKLNSYEDRGLPFSAWLFRIAHNLVANWHRDRSRRRFSSLDRLWGHSSSNTPEQEVERAEKHDALWEAINRLPKERKDLLLYKFSNRLSNVEIGELMDKSESAIKSLYFRTLAALRTDLESRDW